MLGTLMKYEFKAVGRILLPLYGAWLIAAFMLGISIGTIDAVSSPLFVTLSAVLYGGFTMVAVILTCIILIQRFYKNLLGNEGYLMFALPVSTGNHLINKTISGAVWGTAGVIVAVISALVIAVCTEGFDDVFGNMHFIIYDINMVIEEAPGSLLIIPEFLILLLMVFAETAAKVYAAIAVGHQWSDHRVLGSIAAFIGFGIIESVIGNIFDMISNGSVLSWYWSITANLSDTAQVHLSMILLIIGITVVAAIYGFISWKLLDNRLNLE